MVCGAVLRGLEGSIVRQKKCRRHYGHTLSNEYIPSIHTDFDKEKRKVWMDNIKGTEYLSGFMFWKVNKVSNMNNLPSRILLSCPSPLCNMSSNVSFYYAQGDLIDHGTEINSEFISYFTGHIPSSDKHILYSCNLDDTPETIDNERMRILSFLPIAYHLENITEY